LNIRADQTDLAALPEGRRKRRNSPPFIAREKEKKKRKTGRGAEINLSI